MKHFATFFIILILTSIAYAIQLNVQIEGVPKEIEQFLIADLKIYQAIKEPKLTVSRIQNLHDLAPQELMHILEALGYYNATIKSKINHIPSPGYSAATLPHTCEKGSDEWNALYTINLGKPILIDNIDFEVMGEGKDQIPQLKKLLKLQKDKIINHNDYEETKQELLAHMQAEGYLLVSFVASEISINRDLYKADIKLLLNTGKQYVFGPIIFEDNAYAESFLRKFIPFHQGDPYTAENIAAFYKNLNTADMFSKIKLEPKPDFTNPNNIEVPVIVHTVPKPAKRYFGNVGYGTDTSFRVGLGWQHKRLSKHGHRLSTGINYSKILKQIFANYTIPGKQPVTDRYILGAKAIEETVLKKYSKRGEFSVTKTKQFNNKQQDLSIQYFIESYRLIPDTPLIHKHYLLPSIGYTWKNKYDHDKFVCGYSLTASAKGGLHSMLSSTNILQVELDGRWIIPVITNTRLILRGNVGSTYAKNVEDIPFSLRFFAGGDKSIRGFAYQALGPMQKDQENNDVVVGGKKLIVGSAELERRLYKQLSGAIFVDFGNAMNKWKTPFAAGAGIGLRWATPIGSFKLDLARQVAQVQHRSPRIHLTFGVDL